MNYEELMAKARKTNQSRSRSEHKAGFASPEDCDPGHHIRTVMTAIQCGIEVKDWNAVAEGQAMLEDVLPRLYCMELLLKTTKLNAGGCAGYETDLFSIMGEMGLAEALGRMSYSEQQGYVADRAHWSWNEPYELAQRKES